MGRKTREYDANDLVDSKYTYLQWEYTARGKVSAEYDRARNVTRYSYDLEDNLIKVEDPRETGNGVFMGSYVYDDAGRMIYASMPGHDGGSGRAKTWIWYDARGNAVKQQNPDGSIVERTYTPRNKLEIENVKNGGEGANILKKSFTYDLGAYQSQVISGELYTTKTIYDALGRLIETTQVGAGIDKVIYNEAGDVTARIDGNGNMTSYIFDAFGRVIKETDAFKNERTYEYDPLGKISIITDALDRTALYEYDELGRLIQETRADGAKFSYRYDLAGNMLSTVDPNGTTANYQYFPTYRVMAIQKSLGTRSGSASYSYDAAGNLASATMDGVSSVYAVNAYGENLSVVRDGNTVSNILDYAGRRTSINVLEGGATTPLSSTSYQYANGPLISSITGWVDAISWNLAGQAVSTTMANGTGLAMGYDTSGRVTSIGWSGSGSLPSYHFSYDQAGNITAKNGGSYAYDKLNRLLSSAETGPFLTDKDLKALITDTDYSGIKDLEISVEDTDVILDAGSTSVGTRFEGSIEIAGITLSPRISGHRVKTENLEVFIENPPHSFQKTSTATIAISQNTGSIQISFTAPVPAYGVKVHCLFDDRKIDYSIDETNASFANDDESILRVQYLERNRRSTYGYDLAGNRKVETLTDSIGVPFTKTYGYWAGSDRVKTDGKYAYTYDSNGNMMEKGTAFQIGSDGSVTFNAQAGEYWNYSYDLWNRMVGVEHRVAGSATTSSTYTYDPDGLRIKKTGSNVITTYWYGSDSRVAAEKRVVGSNTRLRVFTYAISKLIGYDETIDGITRRYWTATDQIGSVTAETDVGGEMTGRREYANFGCASLSEVTIGSHESLVSFTGKDFDEDAGLYYSNARWYDPNTGRFTSEDPAQDGINWYIYCANNPLRYVDPTGLINVPFWRSALPGDKLPVVKEVNTGSRLLDEALGGLASVYNLAATAVNMPFVAAAAGETAYNAATEAVIGQKGLSGEGLSKDIELVTLFCIQNPQVAAAAGESLKFITGNFSNKVSSLFKSNAPATEAEIPTVTINKSRYPETAQHILDAQAEGQPSILTIDREGAAARRTEALQGVDRVTGAQLDEYPPAMFEEGGAGASVRAIPPSDNMGAGASMGNQLRRYPNGTQVEFGVE
jgi:RHS repeat-associated protein